MDRYKLLARAEKKINATQAALDESSERMKELKVKFSEVSKLNEIFAAIMWQSAQEDDTAKTIRALNQLKTSNLKVEEYARRLYEETKLGLKLLLKHAALNLVWDVLDGANKKTLYPRYAANKAVFSIVIKSAEYLYNEVIEITDVLSNLESLPAHEILEEVKKRPAPPTTNKYIQ